MRMTPEQIAEVYRLIDQAQKGMARYEDGSGMKHATEDEHLAAVVSILNAAAYNIKATQE